MEVTRTEVATLNHEVLDDAVELRALVAETLGELGTVLLDTGRESTEVLHGLGYSLGTSYVDISCRVDKTGPKHVHHHRGQGQLEGQNVRSSIGGGRGGKTDLGPCPCRHA